MIWRYNPLGVFYYTLVANWGQNCQFVFLCNDGDNSLDEKGCTDEFKWMDWEWFWSERVKVCFVCLHSLNICMWPILQENMGKSCHLLRYGVINLHWIGERRHIVVALTTRTAYIIFTCIGPSHYGQHVMGMLDCALLNIVSDVCVTINAPVAEWLRCWSHKLGSQFDSRVGAFFFLTLLFTNSKAVKIKYLPRMIENTLELSEVELH